MKFLGRLRRRKDRKYKKRSKDISEHRGDALRVAEKPSRKKLFGPFVSKNVSFGSAEDILGIIVSPKRRFMENKNGTKEEVAVFCSLDNTIQRLSEEIDLLRQKILETQDDDEQANLRREIDKRERKISSEVRAITYHESPPSDDLFKAMEYLDSGSFLLRSFLRNVEPFTSRLDAIKSWGNSKYAEFIDDFKYFVTRTEDPSLDLSSLTLRDLMYWGEADQMIPEPRESTASLYGKMITRREAGWFMFQAMERYPLDVIARSPLRFREHRGNPLKVACPNTPRFEDDHYVVNNRAYKIYKWPIQFDRAMLDQMLALDVDFLLCVDMPRTEKGRKMFLTVLLRASSEVIDGTFPKLDSITRQLRRFRATPLRGQDFRLAYRAFVPGAEILDRSVRFKFHRKVVRKEAEFLFKILRYKVNAGQTTSQGNYFFGFQNGDRNSPVFRDAETECVSMALIGQQGAGKTFTGSGLFILPRTPNVLAIHFSTARGEGAPLWAKRMAGNVLNIELDDADDMDKEARYKRQEELNEQAVQKAKKLVEDLKEKWMEFSLPVGLPLVIRPVKDTVAYMVYAHTLLEEFSFAWEECFVPESIGDSQKVYEPTDELVFEGAAALDEESEVGLAVDDPRLCAIFLDDISNLDVVAKDPMLGDLPSEVAATAREKIADGLYNYRKRRMSLLVTHQSVTNLLKFYPADAFSTLVTIDLDQKTGAKIGTLYDPKGAVDFGSMKVKASNLDMRFDPFLANHLQSMEDRA